MNWKTLKENLPSLSVLSGVIILLGLINQMIFYRFFGIKIQYFIGLTELPLVICDELTLILILISVIAIMAFIYVDDASPRIKAGLESEGKIKLWVLFRGEFIGAIILVAFNVLFNRKSLNIPYVITIVLILCVTFYPLLFYKISLYYKKKKKQLDKNVLHFIFLGMLLIIYLLYDTTLAIRSTIHGRYIGTKIFTKDSTYVSDKNHFYIGKTQNYYFIYNEDSTTLVIPEREVTKFDLKANL